MAGLKKVLVANRGEISVRVIRACRELGITSVAVYSDADENALHVRLADEAVHIGPASARKSYLNVEKLVEVAKEKGADAIHPGYGFLAENAGFSAACREAGLAFVGPSAEAIERMGDKSAARELARAAGVPVVPGTEGNATPEEAVERAGKIGYPVMVKAAAGAASGSSKARGISRRPSRKPRARRRRRSGRGRCTWRSSSPSRATSRCR